MSESSQVTAGGVGAVGGTGGGGEGVQAGARGGARRGLVIVYTGNGKGKTTAALGMALRAVGHGMKVVMVQFIKGSWRYGEMEGVKRLMPEFELITAGRGFVGIIDDDLPREAHVDAAREALNLSRERLLSGIYDIVILDEVNYAVRLGLIGVDDVLELIRAKPYSTTLVLTGNYADERIIDMADLVTEMREVKHPFRKGMRALKGVDF
ncbi:MAG: cob(I)yrinic acid a,c-diamide adenosyltransferase [Candidatus Nitrosocaldus sp.]|nr:cob(I)yrinic acid a,c-diamide adenosyltransferase [Candidatus Nitrosocaldus sp.]MDW8000203.1 cob(I)yrinic acid a,c-diamide adenosyltransferase [Candidatus Nitrosocaldus sp.]